MKVVIHSLTAAGHICKGNPNSDKLQLLVEGEELKLTMLLLIIFSTGAAFDGGLSFSLLL